MQLHSFIEANFNAIVNEWEAFARTLLPAAQTMSDLTLRDHSREILIGIVKDMRISRTELGRGGQSRDAGPSFPESAAAAHGSVRYAAGFDLQQVVSEFRALRSSVLSLWHRSEAVRGETPAMEELDRFNEAIDQALGESVQRYAGDLATSRNVFLAVLGHDLRSPLQVIQTASSLLAAPGLSEETRLQTAMRLKRASHIMNGLITDLLEFTRSRLGLGIPIERSSCDLRDACAEALDDIRAVEPTREFIHEVSGDLHISADGSRMRQVLSNLLNNAIQHGDEKAPIALRARGDEGAIVLSVENSGKPIPVDALKIIFEPLIQLSDTTTHLDKRPKSSLGLGLFIAREIVLAHQGTIGVESTGDSGTVFTIRLPRELFGLALSSGPR